MNEKNDFALVPRPPGMLERVEPGAKRILSGIVADTLGLANKKPLRIVLVDDEPAVLESTEFAIRHYFKGVVVLKFGDAQEAMNELTREDPDLLITDDMMPGMSGLELLHHLLDRQVTYPIVAFFGYYQEHQVREYANRGLNVTFLQKPFTVPQLTKIIATQLNLSPERAGETASQPRRTRPPRIVVVNDDPTILEIFEGMIRRWFRECTLLLFDDGEEAWAELLRDEPDLLISDLARPKFNGFHMLRLLSEKKVKFPILILSGIVSNNKDAVRQCAGPDLNVTLREIPVEPEQLWQDLLTLVGPSDKPASGVPKDVP